MKVSFDFAFSMIPSIPRGRPSAQTVLTFSPSTLSMVTFVVIALCYYFPGKGELQYSSSITPIHQHFLAKGGKLLFMRYVHINGLLAAIDRLVT